MFALTRKAIPAVIEEVLVYLGGDVPVAAYCTTGSVELADEVSKHLSERAAVLMANHGLFVVARSPQHSLELAQLVELTAEIVWGAMLLGEIVPLPDKIVEQFSSYYRMGRGR
jgi:L-fuculose-phosphate aldolase